MPCETPVGAAASLVSACHAALSRKPLLSRPKIAGVPNGADTLTWSHPDLYLHRNHRTNPPPNIHTHGRTFATMSLRALSLRACAGVGSHTPPSHANRFNLSSQRENLRDTASWWCRHKSVPHNRLHHHHRHHTTATNQSTLTARRRPNVPTPHPQSRRRTARGSTPTRWRPRQPSQAPS
jgi:hypothetical protein